MENFKPVETIHLGEKMVPKLVSILENCELITKYELNANSQIGKGACGTVFQAKEKKSGNHFAIKILFSDNEFEEKQKEIFFLSHLSKCSHIVKIIDAVMEPIENYAVIVMEKADMSLDDLIKEKKKGFDLGYLVQIMLDLLAAIKYAHNEKRISHYDIKPGNVLVFFFFFFKLWGRF